LKEIFLGKEMVLSFVVLAVILVGGIIFGENNIQLFIDNYEVFNDSPPQLIQEEVFIPAIILEEEFGLEVVWSSEKRFLKLKPLIRNSLMVMGKRECTSNRPRRYYPF